MKNIECEIRSFIHAGKYAGLLKFSQKNAAPWRKTFRRPIILTRPKICDTAEQQLFKNLDEKGKSTMKTAKKLKSAAERRFSADGKIILRRSDTKPPSSGSASGTLFCGTTSRRRLITRALRIYYWTGKNVDEENKEKTVRYLKEKNGRTRRGAHPKRRIWRKYRHYKKTEAAYRRIKKIPLGSFLTFIWLVVKYHNNKLKPKICIFHGTNTTSCFEPAEHPPNFYHQQVQLCAARDALRDTRWRITPKSAWMSTARRWKNSLPRRRQINVLAASPCFIRRSRIFDINARTPKNRPSIPTGIFKSFQGEECRRQSGYLSIAKRRHQSNR